jgi:hypothetical protein
MDKNLPWGPHGAEAPPHTVTPNPTAPSAVPTFEQPAEVVMPTLGGGADTFGKIVSNILVSVVMMVILWMPAACLYPLTAAAGIAAGFMTRSILAVVLPADAGDVPFVLGVLVGTIVVGGVIRIEDRLSGSARYRSGRHGVRMVLLAIWAIPIIQLAMGATAPGTSTRYILSVVSSPSAMVQFLTSPLNLGLWFASLIGLHFLIWKGERARQLWHRRLRWIGLR